MALSEAVTVQVHGLAELEKALMQLPEAVAGKALSGAIAAGMGSIRKEATGLIPVGSRAHYLGRKAKGRLVQPGHLSKQLRTRRVRSDKFSCLYALTFSKPGFYGMFHEFGTSKMAANPILRPAFDNRKDRALELIKERLAANIERQRKKLYMENLRAGR